MKARLLPGFSLCRGNLDLVTGANLNKVYHSSHSQPPAYLSREPVTARNNARKKSYFASVSRVLITRAPLHFDIHCWVRLETRNTLHESLLQRAAEMIMLRHPKGRFCFCSWTLGLFLYAPLILHSVHVHNDHTEIAKVS